MLASLCKVVEITGSDIVAIASLGLTFVIFLYQALRERKQSRANLNSEYFRELYSRYLLSEIPQSRTRIVFDKDDKLCGFEDFINLINEMLRESLYYRYVDEEYYLELKTYIQDVEDYILEIANSTIAKELQDNVFSEIEEKLESIYICMTHKYEDG